MKNVNLLGFFVITLLSFLPFSAHSKERPPESAIEKCLEQTENSNPIAKSLTEVDALSHSQKMEMLYPVVDHGNTAFSISLAAGLPIKRALVLGYFSRHPDDNPKYDAFKNFWRYHLRFGNFWRNFVMEKMHSLNGNNHQEINTWRETLAGRISYSIQDPSNDWKTGLLIHAYGDSYAHTKGAYGESSEQAYGPKFGHGWDSLFDSRDPDMIKRDLNGTKDRWPRFAAYAKSLFHLKQQPGFGDHLIDELLEKYLKSDCKSKCQVYFPDTSTSKKDNPLTVFSACMDTTMKPLNSAHAKDVFSGL